MVEFIASVIGALAAGALAKAGDVGGRMLTDAYDALRSLIVHKLGGKSGAVQSVEDEPRSEAAQAVLVEALAEAGLGGDPELAERAKAVRAAITDASGAGANIEVGNITAKANVLISNLVASGRIKLGDITGEDVTLTNLAAGAGAAKKA